MQGKFKKMKHIFFILYINCSYAQSSIQFPNEADWTDQDSNRIYRIKNKKIKISPTGQILEEIYWGYCNHCEGEPNGSYISWFENKNIKELGTYSCSEKINTWLNYFENGKIKSISNFLKPYDQNFFDDVGSSFNLKNKPLKSGAYLEFDSTGLIITEGNYKIFEEHSFVDTIILYDPDTYETSDSLVVKESWHPKSIEVGTWRRFNPILNEYETTNFDEINRKRKLRSIYARYIEIFEIILK